MTTPLLPSTRGGVEEVESKVKLERFSGLELRLNTPKGRGVFATLPISSGTVIDICPVLILSPEDNSHVAQTLLYHYSYNWPVRIDEQSSENPESDYPKRSHTRTHQAIILGLGSMFNHSSQDQNVSWTRDLDHQTVIYKALRDIATGEELCISYGSVLWFKDTDENAGPNKEALDAEAEDDVLRVYMQDDAGT